MSNEIIKVLDYISEKTGIVIDYTQENLLPQVMTVLEKYRTYEIVKMSILVVFVMAVLVIATYFMFNFWKTVKGDIDRLGYGATFVLLIAIIIVAACFASDELLQWIFVPEIQYLDLIKNFMEAS